MRRRGRRGSIRGRSSSRVDGTFLPADRGSDYQWGLEIVGTRGKIVDVIHHILSPKVPIIFSAFYTFTSYFGD